MAYSLSTKKIILTFLIMMMGFFALIYFQIDQINWKIALLISFTFNVTGISFFFIKKRLYKLSIDEKRNALFLFYRKYFFVESTEEILFDSLTFSYKEEVGVQGIKGKEFRIYENKIKLFRIDCTLDGWEKKTVYEIVAKFRELGLNEIK